MAIGEQPESITTMLAETPSGLILGHLIDLAVTHSFLGLPDIIIACTVVLGAYLTKLWRYKHEK